MRRLPSSSVTLIELLLAIALIWLVILATSNIDLFSRGYLLSADRRSGLQNEVVLVADDICKNVASAPGNFTNKAVTVTGFNLTVRNETASINYNLTNYKIQKDGVDMNNRGVIAVFDPHELDSGIGVELNITGRYNPLQSTTINNPEVNITTRCYSHQASAR